MLAHGEQQTVATPDGRAWTVGRLELRVIRAFGQWVTGRVGDPFAIVEKYLDRLPPDKALELIREAEAVRDQLRSFSLACPLARQYLGTEEGMAQLTLLLLQPAHPDATIEDAFLVAGELGRRLEEAMKQAAGAVPNGAAPGPVAAPGMCALTGGKSTGG